MALCDFDCRFLAMWHFLFKHIKCSYEGYFDPQNSQAARLRQFTDSDRLLSFACFPWYFYVY